MPSEPSQTRRRGAPCGNTNRLVHGRYRRQSKIGRRQMSDWVARCRAICRKVGGLDATWAELNRRGLAKSKTRAIDVRMAVMLFKYLKTALKTAPELEIERFEPKSGGEGGRAASEVQFPATGTPSPVPPVESL